MVFRRRRFKQYLSRFKRNAGRSKAASLKTKRLKSLDVISVKKIGYQSSVTEISGLLDRLDKNEINMVPWPAHPYKPSASFTIAAGPDCLFIKYFVTEQHLRATNDESNAPVWEDSCVEVFISFGDSGYYNFELNCIGTILAAYGPNRHERKFLSPVIIKAIKTFTVIDRMTAGPSISWDLIVVIPLSVFVHDHIKSLQGVEARANFFKCGEKTQQPHYLSWNNIETPEPDFHQPGFFGKLRFLRPE